LPIPDDLVRPSAPDLGADERQRPGWRIMAATEIVSYVQLCRALRARTLGEEGVSPITTATFADGLANMRVMDAIRTSVAEAGRLVRSALLSGAPQKSGGRFSPQGAVGHPLRSDH
jgi:hypothetical protein